MSVAERTLLQLVAKQRPPPCVGIGHELPGRVGLGWPPPHMAGMEMQCVHHRFRCRCWKRPCLALCSNPVLQNQKAELWILCVWRRTLQKGERRTRQIGTHTSLCTISLCCVLVHHTAAAPARSAPRCWVSTDAETASHFETRPAALSIRQIRKKPSFGYTCAGTMLWHGAVSSVEWHPEEGVELAGVNLTAHFE